MEAQRCFTGRKQHRHGGQVHFAEVTIRAEPCLGESEVVLSKGVLDTLREVFGDDFEHQRHCVWAAVSVQLSTVNVAGDYPHAGAASFRVEVVGVRISGNAGREVSGFLLSVAGMDAIGEYLTAWEDEQGPPTGGGASAAEAPESPIACDIVLTEDDLRCVIYQSTYVLAWNDINDGLTCDEVRGLYEPAVRAAGRHADVAGEAVADALAGLRMRYKSRRFS
jgi:hypothetical protein